MNFCTVFKVINKGDFCSKLFPSSYDFGKTLGFTFNMNGFYINSRNSLRFIYTSNVGLAFSLTIKGWHPAGGTSRVKMAKQPIIYP
jgi:hypothetical protein